MRYNDDIIVDKNSPVYYARQQKFEQPSPWCSSGGQRFSRTCYSTCNNYYSIQMYIAETLLPFFYIYTIITRKVIIGDMLLLPIYLPPSVTHHTHSLMIKVIFYRTIQ